MAEEEAEETMFIPVIIFVFDKAAYVDREGSLGTAVPDPADNTIPCCAVVAIDKHSLFDIGAGLSFVTIHEMGHVLGLRHPHDGSNPTQGEFFNWFFDWSYTPMTYSSPSSLGCGLGFVGCGLVITEFGQFNYDALDRGMVLYLLNQAQSNIRDSMLQIEEKGYGKNIPTFISAKMSSIDTDMENAKEHFAKMTYFNHTTFKDLSSIMDPMDDAFDFALRAELNSEALLEASNNLSIKTEFDGVNTISISRPRLVDELGSNVGSVEVSKPIGITSQVLNKIEGTVVFTYIVQVKDNDGATVFLEWVDDLSTSDEGVESSIFWTPDTTGAYQVEIFVWENVLNPLPLAPIKSIRVVVNG